MASSIIDPQTYPLRPEHIRSDRALMGTFDRLEAESSALWIVLLCQARGSWEPFTLAQLQAFYQPKGRPPNETFLFNGLIERGYIVDEGGKYHLTHMFIARCFTQAPACL